MCFNGKSLKNRNVQFMMTAFICMYGKRLIDRFLIARLMVRREVKSNLTTFSGISEVFA